MKYKDLTEEQKSKIANTKSPEEILQMAKAEGYELTNEELEGISGGSLWATNIIAPYAGAMTSACTKNGKNGNCHSCGYEGPLHQFLH